MAVTLNTRGTTVPYFKIGKGGTTIYQGDNDPSNTYNINTGDIWIDRTTEKLKFRDAVGAWHIQLDSINDLTDVDISSNIPIDGQTLVWDNSNSKFVPGDSSDFSAATSNILPATTNTYDIGSSTKVWNNLWASTGNIDNLTVSGDLVVSGSVTTIDTTNLTVSDNIIILNNDVTGTPSEDAGLEIERGTSTNVSIAWNESTDRWTFTNDGTTYHNLIINSDDLAEGTVNEYYDDSKVDARIAISSIDDLADVDLTTSAPVDKQILKWDGVNNKFAPGNEFSTLNLSVGSPVAPNGAGGITYNNTTGVFTYIPPDLSAYVSTWSDITGTPTTIAGYGITDAFDGNYSSLTNKPTIPTALTDLNITDGITGQVLQTNGANAFSFGTLDINDLTDGAGLLYNNDAARAAISATGNLSYDSTTGVMTTTSVFTGDVKGNIINPNNVPILTVGTGNNDSQLVVYEAIADELTVKNSTVSRTITQGSTDYNTKQYVLFGTTTDATETEIFVRGMPNNRIPVATDTTIFYDVTFVARRTDATGESAGIELKGVVDNFSDTVADVGDLYEILVASDNTNLVVEAAADDTNNSIKISVTGEASKTFRWTAIVKTTEVTQ